MCLASASSWERRRRVWLVCLPGPCSLSATELASASTDPWELARCCCGDGGGSSISWLFCPPDPAPLRRLVAPAPARIAGGLCRSVFLRQLFFVARLRVCELASARVSSPTAGTNRGVAPADVPPSVFRSRRPRRVVFAATTTRWFPPKVLPGDIAAAGVVFVSPSGGATAIVRAAADSSVQSWVQGLGCNFLFFRGLSAKFGTAVLFLDVSCMHVFLT